MTAGTLDPVVVTARAPTSGPLISVVDAVLGGCELLRPVREAPRNSNDGQLVRPILESVRLKPGQPWCAALVYYVGRGVLGARWPGPQTGSCDLILEWAERNGILLLEEQAFHRLGARPQDRAKIGVPRRGDLFLRMKSRWDADHIGFVRVPTATRAFDTWEGNTNGAASREGNGMFPLTRGDADDDDVYAFVPWYSLVR